MSNANIEVVKQGLERFLAGDIPGFVEFLTSDIEWDHRGPEGVPYNRMYKGREEVVGFLQTLDELLENVSFDVNEYFACGDRVVSVGHFSWKVKATDKVWASDFAMTCTVRDGKITHWKPIFDMGTEAVAFQRPWMSLRRTLAALAVALVVGLAAHVGVLRLGWLRPPHSGLTTEIAWAVGIPGDLYNFGVVVPGRVFRSAEPDERFIRHLYERHGVRRVISLNGKQPYQAFARELGMSVDLYAWKPFHRPGDDQLKRVLDTFDDGTPVLVHCTFGRDRTGYAVGAYRVWRQGWPVDRTLEELDSFGHSTGEAPWIDATLTFFKSEPRMQ